MQSGKINNMEQETQRQKRLRLYKEFTDKLEEMKNFLADVQYKQIEDGNKSD